MGKMKEKYTLEPELLEVQENWDVLSNKIQVRHKMSFFFLSSIFFSPLKLTIVSFCSLLSLKTLVTSYEVDVKRTTIEQLRASPVQLPTSQPGSPRLDEISSKIRQMHVDIEELNNDTARKLSLEDMNSIQELQELMKVSNFF